MNAKKHTPLSLHGLRLLFPPLATLGILFLTEWIARGSLTGETFTQYIFPHAEAYLLAWAMLFLSWLAVDWLTRFAPLATLLAAVLGCAPAAVNFYTLQLRGEPFLPWDLMQVSEAAGVAAAAGIHIQTSMVVSIVIIVLLVVVSFFLYRGRQKLNWKPRVAGFLASAAATCGLLFGVFLQPAVTQAIGIVPDAWMQDRYYRYYGVITSFLTNLTNLEISKPEGYSEEAVNEILDDTEAAQKYSTAPLYPGSYGATTSADETVKKPTIIYVMDESYWDVSELEQYGFQFDTDVSANLHALQQTSASGRAYSPSFGGGTCDVEFEALTGYSASFLPNGSKPYQQHVTKPMFSLPNYLKLTQGYQTAAVHCFWAKYWSRDTAYPNLGFDTFLSLEQMTHVNKVRRHYWTSGLVTDDSMADQVIQQYEKMKASSDAPVFLHAVTMQNHTNYNKDNYPDDWLFHDFDSKMYSAIYGYEKPDTVANKFGIKTEKYYQSCSLVRKQPDMKRMVMRYTYAIILLTICGVLSIVSSMYFMPCGILGFFILVGYEQMTLNAKAESMKAQIADELPRFLDLLQAELQIGMPIENAMLVICEKFPSLISTEFLRALSESQMGASGWQQAMEDVAARYDEETLSDFVLNVSTSYTKGVSIAATVSRKAEDIRETHVLAVKERAGKVTNTILLPMAIFLLL